MLTTDSLERLRGSKFGDSGTCRPPEAEAVESRRSDMTDGEGGFGALDGKWYGDYNQQRLTDRTTRGEARKSRDANLQGEAVLNSVDAFNMARPLTFPTVTPTASVLSF